MNRKSAHIPIYSLGNVKQSDIHLRPLKDYVTPRPAFETSHSDSYYIFIFQQTGESKLIVDFETVTLSGSSVYLIAPGQVHYFISSNHTSGWILAAEPQSIDQTYIDVLEREYGQQKPTAINEPSGNMLESCLKSLSDLLSGYLDAYLQHSMLSNMVSVCAGLFTSFMSYAGYDQHPSRQLYLYQQFRILLRKHFKNQKSPAAYAELLCVSPGYLSECVKAISGRPVSYWIQQQTVLEAKRLLAYSKLGVKQIAYQLGYPDDTYFIRLFKKSAAVSPSAFRKHTANCTAFT